MSTARDSYQLAVAWDLLDDIYGNQDDAKERRVDHHGFIRQGTLDEFPQLKRIANAIFQGSNFVDLDGKRIYTKKMAGGTITGLDHKGIRYVEQNPASGSTYARRARAGEKIIWVMRTNGGYIGRIDNGIVWKDPKHIKPKVLQPDPQQTVVIHIKDAPAGWKNDPRFVYIGRRNFAESLPRSKWCNPVSLRTNDPQERALNLEQYQENFEISELRQQVGELKGKILVCYCKPRGCHGDILAAAANAA